MHFSCVNAGDMNVSRNETRYKYRQAICDVIILLLIEQREGQGTGSSIVFAMNANLKNVLFVAYVA